MPKKEPQPKRADLIECEIPQRLRSYKGTGVYDSAELEDGTFLTWSHPVGERLAVVFRYGGRPRVGVLNTRRDVFEKLVTVRADDVDVDSLSSLAERHARFEDDDHVIACRGAIEIAKRWTAELQERKAPKAKPAAAAWLRRQLSSFDEWTA